MDRRIWLVAVVLLLPAAALAGDGVRLSAGEIHTWVDGGTRVLVLGKDPRVVSGGGTLTSDEMVIWFDENAAAKSGRIELTVYSEKSGSGALARVTGTGSLTVDDRGLVAHSEGQESRLYSRATAALAEARRIKQSDAQAPVVSPAPETPVLRQPAIPAPQAEPGAVAIPDVAVSTDASLQAPSAATESVLTAPSTSSELAAAAVNKKAGESEPRTEAPAAPAAAEEPKEAAKPQSAGQPSAGQPSAGQPSAGQKLLESISRTQPGDQKAAEITYSATTAAGYSMETRQEDGASLIIITGGIEIALGNYKMRSNNMVIRMISGEGDTVKQLQVYAEGDVHFITPAAALNAERLFYDSADDSATLVDAEVYAELTLGGLPLIVRARKVRSYAGALYRADNAVATTCAFADPHYHFAAKTASVIPIRHDDGTDSALVVSRNNKFYAGPIPILSWKEMSRDITETNTPLRRLQGGHSGKFGYYAYSSWDVFDLIGGSSPDSPAARMSRWSDLTWALDYRTQRGPGTGFEYTYKKPWISGELDTYYTKDNGTDSNGFKPSSEDRGRVKWRQRAFYEDYQIDSEFGYVSDRGFLREYHEREAKEEKEPETYLYVKRPWEYSQAGFLYRTRINEYQQRPGDLSTQADYLPQARYDVVGYPMWDGAVVYNQTTRADNVRFRPDDALGLGTAQTQRVDTYHVFETPLATACGLTFTPFTTVRESYFSKAVGQDSVNRFAGSWGAKVSTPALWHVYDVSSPMLNINRLRHIVNFDFTYEDVYDSTRTPSELFQFDDVDQVKRMDVATLALRQRLQTKRDGIGQGDPRRTVDLVTFDAEADYFPHPGRDNSDRIWSDLRLNSRAMITDDISLITDGDYNTADGTFDKAGVWVMMDHSPRTTVAVGNRYIRRVSSSVVTGSIDHQITERWETGALAQYDVDTGQNLQERLVLRRNVDEFAIEFYASFDRGGGNWNYGVNVYPMTTKGLRRF